jgi:hypothetical protein
MSRRGRLHEQSCGTTEVPKASRKEWSAVVVAGKVVSTLGTDAACMSGRLAPPLFDIVNGKRCVDGGVPFRLTTCTHPYAHDLVGSPRPCGAVA